MWHANLHDVAVSFVEWELYQYNGSQNIVATKAIKQFSYNFLFLSLDGYVWLPSQNGGIKHWGCVIRYIHRAPLGKSHSILLTQAAISLHLWRVPWSGCFHPDFLSGKRGNYILQLPKKATKLEADDPNFLKTNCRTDSKADKNIAVSLSGGQQLLWLPHNLPTNGLSGPSLKVRFDL